MKQCAAMEYLGCYTTKKYYQSVIKSCLDPHFTSIFALGFDDTGVLFISEHSKICLSIIVNMKVPKDTFRNKNINTLFKIQ